MFAIKLALAGLGHMIGHWSIGLIIIAACIAIEFCSGWIISMVPILAKPIGFLQKYVLLIAIGTGLVLMGEWIGARDAADRCEAKAVVVEQTVDKAVAKTKTPKAQHQADPWDSKDN